MSRVAITGGSGFVGRHVAVRLRATARPRPTTPFDADTIRAGLPPARGFGCRDLRWCRG